LRDVEDEEERMQRNRLSENNEEGMCELRVSYVGEPTVGDGGGMCCWGSEQEDVVSSFVSRVKC
jgi:hypothetical protein